MLRYVTIIDPTGGEYGAERIPVPVSHRMIFENKRFYGFESMRKLFNSQDELMRFLVRVVAEPVGTTGTHGSLSWSVDDK